jgi:hypothetical protein
LDPYNKVEDQIYKSSMYTALQSGIGGGKKKPSEDNCLGLWSAWHATLPHDLNLLITIFGLAQYPFRKG